MADIFDEINAELRQDRLRQVWERYGIYVIGFALAVVLFIAGSSAWNSYVTSKNEQASAAYEAMLAEIDGADIGIQIESLSNFSKTASASYGILADLRRAKLLVENNQLDDAVLLYDELSARRDIPLALRDYVSLASAALLLESYKPDALETRLREMLGEQNPFRHAAREMMALSHFQTGNYLEASRFVKTALADVELSPQMQIRFTVLDKSLDSYLREGDK
ncbi:MAG: tetratricopeptide repeat protein [Parvibaculales bacterium]